MKTTKTMASTARKSAKRVTIAAMAASMAAMSVAERDMRAEFGKNYIPMDKTVINYTYDPFDGLYA